MIGVDKDLKDELAKLHRTSASLAKLLAQFERLSSRPVENAYALDEVLAQITRHSGDFTIPDASGRLASWSQAAANEVSVLKETFKHDFGRTLQGLLQDQAFELGGRYPDLKAKWFTIHVDFGKGLASLAFGHEITKQRIPLTADDVAGAVAQAQRHLDQPFDPKTFMEKLGEAYQRVCRIRQLSCGEKVPVLEVLQHFVFLLQSSQFVADPSKDHYRGYSRAQFGYDLYRLRLSGARTVDNQTVGLLTATFDATRKREQFIWVPDNDRGEGTTYALLFFKRPDDSLP